MFSFFKKKKLEREQAFRDELVEWAKNNEKRFLERAEKYKTIHPDWEQMPKEANIHGIFAITNIIYEGSSVTVLKYCYFKFISFTESTIKIEYKDVIPATHFSSAKYITHYTELRKADFNKTWFLSDELAMPEVIKEIKEGNRTIDSEPLYYGDSMYVQKFLKRDNF